MHNGGLLGSTITLYKGNFFNATTLSTGANIASGTNMYGHEDITMLMAGIGNKTGYNFEFKEGKYIVQPTMLLSYTFVNTFDYTNAANVRINSDPLHSVQLAPGVKFIGNFNKGWQPYFRTSMIWDVMGKSNVYANGEKLPQMGIKPYIQYGVGIQKRIQDHFMAYGEAIVQNGGRNGISLNGGLRWAVGHNCQSTPKNKTLSDNVKKVNNVTKSTKSVAKQPQTFESKEVKQVSKTSLVQNESQTQRKVIKQLSQQSRIMINSGFTSRTPNVGIVKK